MRGIDDAGGSLRLRIVVRPRIISADEERPRSRAEGDAMVFLEVAIGMMAAAILAVPVLMAVTARGNDGSERRSG